MKKFFTVIPNQKIEKETYLKENNPDLKEDIETAFPIIASIAGNCESGDRIVVLPILFEADENSESYKSFCEELKSVAKSKDITCIVRPIKQEIYNPVDKSMNLYMNLLGTIRDYDEVYSCISYGSKELSLIFTGYLLFAYINEEKVKINDILCKKEKSEVPVIENLNSVFYIDLSISNLAVDKFKNLDKNIDKKQESTLRLNV